MKEAKSPKKPLIFYYGVVLAVLLAFNMIVSPVLSFTLCPICPYTARRLYVAAGKTGHYNIRVG